MPSKICFSDEMIYTDTMHEGYLEELREARVRTERVRREKYEKAEVEAERILEMMGDGFLDLEACRICGVDGGAWYRWRTTGINQRRYADAQGAMGANLMQRKYLEAQQEDDEPRLKWESTVEFLKRTQPATYGDKQTLLQEVRVIQSDTPEELRLRIDEIKRQYATRLLEPQKETINGQHGDGMEDQSGAGSEDAGGIAQEG